MVTGNDIFHWGMSAQRIYKELTTGPGVESLYQAQESTVLERKNEVNRAILVKEIGAGVEAGWQGEAGQGAMGATLPVAQAANVGVEHLHRGQDLLSRQGESFETAKNTVEPVGESPDIELDDMFNGDLEEKIVQHGQAEQRNIEAFEQYDGASMYNEENMPKEYTPPNHSGGDISVGDDSGGGMIDSDDYRDDSGGSGGPEGSGPGNYSAPSGGPPGAGAPPGGVTPSGVPINSGTSTSGYDPSQRPMPYPPAAAGPNQYGPGGTPPGGGLVGPGPYGGGGSSSGPGGGGRGGGGGFGGRPGGGGAPVGGPAPRGGMPGGPGAGGMAAEEAARRGAIGGGGVAGRGGGAPMGAPMGGGRGKGDDDTEHDRKYMYGPDPDALFDTDVLTAPPVIGEDDEQ